MGYVIVGGICFILGAFIGACLVALMVACKNAGEIELENEEDSRL